MAGATGPITVSAAQSKEEMPMEPAIRPVVHESLTGSKPEERRTVEPAALVSAAGVDRTAIARIVETVLAGQGIVRGSFASKIVSAAPAAKEMQNPSTIAAEIANRVFGSATNTGSETTVAAPAADSDASPVQTLAPAAAAPSQEPSAKLVVEISPFVSENDVRRAMTRSEKIFIGPKTILTPSARDLGMEHEVFVETEAGSIR